VFGTMSDKALEQLVERFKLKVFFVNDTRQVSKMTVHAAAVC
jgi:hypothetical protein